MKKVLSFVLVLAMILGSASMAFAAPATTAAAPTKDNTVAPFEDAVNSEVATVLKDMGVLTGDNGKVYLDETITRAEYCTLIVRALGLAAVAQAKAETKFTDVPKNAWYSGYVATAVSQGVVDGTSATTFEPDEFVTADEAIAFVVKALGYTADHLDGTWPVNYRLVANDLGIVPTGYEYEVEEATRGSVFEIIYKALDVAFVKWNPQLGTWDPKPGNPSFNTRLGAGLAADAVYTTTNKAITAGAKLVNGVDTTPYIGQNVKVLQKNGEDIAIVGLASDALEGQFTTKTAFKLADGTTVVVTGGATNLTPQAVYLNGSSVAVTVAVPTGVAMSVVAEKNAQGQIATLCTVTYEQLNEVVYVEGATAAAFANPTSLAAVFPAFTSGTGAKAEYLNVKVEGAAKTLAEITEDDVLEIYYVAGNASAKVYKVVVVRDKVVGPVVAIGTKTPTLYTMGGKDYAVAASTSSFTAPTQAEVKAGTSYAFYLGSDGKIVAAGYADKEAQPEPTTTVYAFALTGAATKTTYKWDETGSSASVKTTIDLVILGETEAKTYTVTGGGILDAAASTSLVAIELNAKGELVTMQAVATTTTNALYIDKYGVDNIAIANNAKVIVLDKTLTGTNAAYYAPKTVADIKTTTWGTISYTTNAAGQMDLVIVKAGGPAAAPEAQKYAYITDIKLYNVGANKSATKASIVIVGGEADAYALTGTAATLVMDAVSPEAIYAVTLSGTNMTATSKEACTTIATTTGIKLEGTNLMSGSAIVATVATDATVLVYDAKTKTMTVAEDLNEALKAGKEVDLYDLVKDSGTNAWIDCIVVR